MVRLSLFSATVVLLVGVHQTTAYGRSRNTVTPPRIDYGKLTLSCHLLALELVSPRKHTKIFQLDFERETSYLMRAIFGTILKASFQFRLESAFFRFGGEKVRFLIQITLIQSKEGGEIVCCEL